MIAVSSLLLSGAIKAYIRLPGFPKLPIIYFQLPLCGEPFQLNHIPSTDNNTDQHWQNPNIQLACTYE